jgi:D-amino peptidase
MKIKRTLLAAFSLILLAITCTAQGKPLKVFISADMEGVDGVSTWDVQANAKGREYEEFRRLMTQEVNAAVAGAFDAGGTYILVADSHGDAQNIDPALLDGRAELIRAWPRPLGMMEGIDSSFAAAIFIGYHASEGTPGAVLSHTFTGTMAVRLNGTAVPEAGFNAAIAGDFGVPVVFVSGDQAIGDEAKRLLGPIETVAVKQAIGFHAAKMMSPQKAQELIRADVRKAIEGRGEIKPYRMTRPISLQIRFKDPITAELVSYLPAVQRPAGDTIVFSARDMIEASKFVEAISSLSIRP